MAGDSNTVDLFGRAPIAAGMKRQIEDAFKLVPEGKRGAVIVFHDFDTGETTAALAARFDVGKSEWKVAGGPRFKWTGEKPSGWIAVMGSW